LKRITPLLVALAMIILLLLATSLLDILLVFFYARFYTSILFIVTFGVGGVFAGTMGYMYGMQSAMYKDELTRWMLIIFIILIGLLLFLVVVIFEGGEYEGAFRAYGITMALSTLLFIRGKAEL
jgi:hypothetical protein